jgi:hypothetical protein
MSILVKTEIKIYFFNVFWKNEEKEETFNTSRILSSLGSTCHNVKCSSIEFYWGGGGGGYLSRI